MRLIKIFLWALIRILPFLIGIIVVLVLWQQDKRELAIALLGVIIAFAATLTLLFLYWRYYYFLRDPERNIPNGANIVSPADGTVVYAKQIVEGKVPISIKGKKEIPLKELSRLDLAGQFDKGYIIGIFMSMFDVHVNRAPISGTVKKVVYSSSKRNLDMERLARNLMLKRRPLLPQNPEYLVANERNTIVIAGEFPIGVIQIADEYVNKIQCWKDEGSQTKKGERVGLIRMGSQVDVIIPPLEHLDIVVTEGDHVKAGESIIATY